MADFLNFFNRLSFSPLSGNLTYTDFETKFFANPHHQWIRSCPLTMKNFSIFFRLFPIKILRRISYKDISFAPCNGNMSATISLPRKGNVILLFPELTTNLRSANPSDAFAIMAHEIGHIYLNHRKRGVDPMRAQHEADLFTCQVGLFEELEEILSRSSSSELTERLYFIRKKQASI